MGDAATLARRGLALVYEWLLATAYTLIVLLPFTWVTEGWEWPLKRLLTQAYLVLLLGVYFVWQWTHGGQTLAMKTWHLKLVMHAGEPVSPARAIVRYALALAGTALAGAGFLWGLFDRERQFLHDRLAGTRIIYAPAARSSPARCSGK